MTEEKENKFVKEDEVSSLFGSLIKQESERRSWNYPTSVFDPSHITECPRRMIYRANGCTPETNVSYLIANNEIHLKKKWTEYLSKCRSVRVIGKNVVTADCHYNISGNIDAILNIGERNYVTQIQLVQDEEFKQIRKKGAFKKHVVEMIVYIWLTELRDGLLLYENKDSNEYTVFHVKIYEPVIKSVIKKCLGLMENKIQGTIPSRPYKTKDSNECIVCEYSKKCWEKK
jgi:hypothetical protein